MIELSQEQYAAVTATASQIVVAACPGAGKTRVLVERVKSLLASGVPPADICCVTFTTAGAGEIAKRIGTDTKLGHSGTLHALMLRAIRKQFKECVYSSPPVVLDEAQAEELLDEAIKETRCTSISKDVLKKVIAVDVPKQTLTKAETCAAYYHQKLAQEGVVDYDGILRLGLRLVKAEQFPFKFTHLICDEMQDSSAMDFLIYRYMEVDNRFFVGDFDQQIYGFRGACSGFEDLCKNKSGIQRELYKLQTCYRCSEEICAAAARVLTLIPDRMKMEFRSVNGSKGKPLVQSFDGFPAELAWLAGDLTANAAAGVCLLDEAAVLLRTNALVLAYRNGLKAMGIPVREQRSCWNLDGWQKAQAVIAHYCDPLNDRAALEFVRVKSGDDMAKKVQKIAAVEMCSVSEVINMGGKLDMTFNNSVIEMVKSGVPPATIETVESLYEVASCDLSELLLIMHQPPEDQSGAGVFVGTMHSAKGREWDEVYLPAFEDQAFPANRDIAEETRLCFVALTRARNKVSISWAEQRPNTYTKRIQAMEPSRFVELILQSANVRISDAEIKK